MYGVEGWLNFRTLAPLQQMKFSGREENNKINVKDLLSHRTGLPNYMTLEFLGDNTREQLFQDLFYGEQVRNFLCNYFFNRVCN